MRHIRVPKRRSPLWSWLVGLIVLLLLVWGISTMLDSKELKSARRVPAALGLVSPWGREPGSAPHHASAAPGGRIFAPVDG